MKKLLSILLAFICLVTFSACGEKKIDKSMHKVTISNTQTKTKITAIVPKELKEDTFLGATSGFDGANRFHIRFEFYDADKDWFEDYQEWELSYIKEDENCSNLECNDINFDNCEGVMYTYEEELAYSYTSIVTDYYIEVYDDIFVQITSSIPKGNELKYDVLEIIESIEPVEK